MLNTHLETLRHRLPGHNDVFRLSQTLTGRRLCRPIFASRKSKGLKAKQPFSRPADKVSERKAALTYEREQSRHELERAKEEAARQKERERRQQAVDKAQAALDKAEQSHAQRAAAVQAEVEALEKRSQTEEARWDKEKERLEAALRRAWG
jgi:hypothetical protein